MSQEQHQRPLRQEQASLSRLRGVCLPDTQQDFARRLAKVRVDDLPADLMTRTRTQMQAACRHGWALQPRPVHREGAWNLVMTALAAACLILALMRQSDVLPAASLPEQVAEDQWQLARHDELIEQWLEIRGRFTNPTQLNS